MQKCCSVVSASSTRLFPSLQATTRVAIDVGSSGMKVTAAKIKDCRIEDICFSKAYPDSF